MSDALLVIPCNRLCGAWTTVKFPVTFEAGRELLLNGWYLALVDNELSPLVLEPLCRTCAIKIHGLGVIQTAEQCARDAQKVLSS